MSKVHEFRDIVTTVLERAGAPGGHARGVGAARLADFGAFAFGHFTARDGAPRVVGPGGERHALIMKDQRHGMYVGNLAVVARVGQDGILFRRWQNEMPSGQAFTTERSLGNGKELVAAVELALSPHLNLEAFWKAAGLTSEEQSQIAEEKAYDLQNAQSMPFRRRTLDPYTWLR